MTPDPEFQLLIDKWGSEEHLNSFLKSEVKKLAKIICGESVSVPNVQVKPSWLARGLLGEHPFAGGDYEPSDGELAATIGLFPPIVMDEKMTLIVLAHELIHHWEDTIGKEATESPYPRKVDKMISKRFRMISKRLSTAPREFSWRRRHSKKFIAKAVVVAEELNVELDGLLFSTL